MKIILADLNKNVVNAWKKYFDGNENVTIHHGSVFDLETDAWVAPGNSFGYMDGGIDLVYRDRFGMELEEMVQKVIRTSRPQELLVGDAFCLRVMENTKLFIYAPTMRVPMILRDTVNPYLATKAAWGLAKQFRIGTITFPGMGTGVGQVDPDVCAKQMRVAMSEEHGFPGSIMDATEQQLYLKGRQ